MEANGTDPVPDQVRQARIIANTLEPMKTHLQLNVGNRGNVDVLRVATADYLRSRHIFKTTVTVIPPDDDPMEVDILSRTGLNCRGKLGRGRKGGKKVKTITRAEVAENKSLTNLCIPRITVVTVGTEAQPATIGIPPGDGKRKSKVSDVRVKATNALTDSSHPVPQSQVSG